MGLELSNDTKSGAVDTSPRVPTEMLYIPTILDRVVAVLGRIDFIPLPELIESSKASSD